MLVTERRTRGARSRVRKAPLPVRARIDDHVTCHVSSDSQLMAHPDELFSNHTGESRQLMKHAKRPHTVSTLSAERSGQAVVPPDRRPSGEIRHGTGPYTTGLWIPRIADVPKSIEPGQLSQSANRFLVRSSQKVKGARHIHCLDEVGLSPMLARSRELGRMRDGRRLINSYRWSLAHGGQQLYERNNPLGDPYRQHPRASTRCLTSRLGSVVQDLRWSYYCMAIAACGRTIGREPLSAPSQLTLPVQNKAADK